MKNRVCLIVLILGLISCNSKYIEKPENLIQEDQMIDIIYDLSILEAIKSSNPVLLENNNIDPYTYIYKKYNIDSLQFAQSNAYYASNLKKYRKMYSEVEQKIQDKKIVADSLLQKENSRQEKPKLLSKDTINPKKILTSKQ
jgi:hypothetical protein